MKTKLHLQKLKTQLSYDKQYYVKFEKGNNDN